MSSVVYLVRHAESEHNISKDFTQRDPPLTATGLTQASTLIETFPDTASIAVVLTSPLTRTLQTTITGFPQVFRKDTAGSARVIIDPDLQERSDLPCDTGSGRLELNEAFPGLSFEGLEDEWFIKDGLYAVDDVAVAKRAQRFRNRLRDIIASLEDGGEANEGRRRDVVVVTHGVFMKFLAEDEAIDLPKAGWKAFRIGDRGDGGAILLPFE
ncbi:histidine phosphatase superfamily [Microdochium trichocladiopsis]|uniref:Histidine phosphatase superfamily n=1 Tax=Microdochium trichocladiopsis TaxID=1682393 RepID=A0A9P8XP49_9PEZI|nr:histidine phosphatase superfamily [Microdochium trichocladiopsis]KAH7007887.1 histidine phosphatase superfamily [Microdochium trichocladiopsis]